MSVDSALQPPTPTHRSEGIVAYLRDLDWILLIAAFGASILGAVLVWSASRADLAAADDPQSFLKRHLINIGIGVILGYLASRIGYRWLRAYAPILYGVAVVLLLLVFPFGRGIAGAKAWIALPGGFTIQPSEFAKIAIILMMAVILAEKHDANDAPRDKDVLLSLALAGFPMLVILLQNDTGTVLVIGAIAVTLIAISGAKRRWIIGLLGGAVIGLLAAIQFGLLQSYQVQRLTSFINPTGDPGAAAFNANQARIAIGGGGLTGHGLFAGPQTQGNFVPVNESDFVFTVAGEEFGFIGAMVLIVLLAIVIWRGIRIAILADDLYGRLLATGVVAWIAFQMFENIGMNLGIMPITGVPLPLVSSGGTAMMAVWIGIGLLQNVHIHAAGSRD